MQNNFFMIYILINYYKPLYNFHLRSKMALLKVITIGRTLQTQPFDQYLAQGYAIQPLSSRYPAQHSSLQLFKSLAGAPTLRDPIDFSRGIIKNYNL